MTSRPTPRHCSSRPAHPPRWERSFLAVLAERSAGPRPLHQAHRPPRHSAGVWVRELRRLRGRGTTIAAFALPEAVCSFSQPQASAELPPATGTEITSFGPFGAMIICEAPAIRNRAFRFFAKRTGSHLRDATHFQNFLTAQNEHFPPQLRPLAATITVFHSSSLSRTVDSTPGNASLLHTDRDFRVI